MSELGRDGTGAIDEDRLPWLEPVDDIDARADGVAAGKLIGAVIAALVAIGLIIGGSFWLRQRSVEIADAGDRPATIPAPPGPYKVKPAEPGGMKVPGQGDASYSASTGADPNAQIDTSAVPETPIATTKAPPPPPAPAPAPAKTAVAAATPAKPGAKAELPTTTAKLPTATAAATKPAAAAPVAAKPAAPVAGGTQIQLGSFSSQAKADAAWKSLTGRFAYLAPLQQVVASGDVGGKPVFRLRAVAGAQAGSICGKLKVAGETCIIAQQ